jgi:hypothetical protein
MRRKLTRDELDRLGRELFQIRNTELEETSPDAVFLAGFREKLDRLESLKTSVWMLIGETAWKASPGLAALCIALTLFLSFADTQPSTTYDPTDEIVWTLSTDEEPELTRDQILETLLSLNGEGGDQP